MRWTKKLGDNIKRGLRSWLQIQPSNPYSIQIQEVMDFELSAIRNRIWYRGDGNELEQLYQQTTEYADRYKFWASRCTPGMEMRKIHTGLPGLIVRVLSGIVLEDMNDFEFEQSSHEALWKEIEKENKFRKLMESCLKEVLYIGDGAFKVTIDTSLSQYPILEWYPGERVEIIQERGRLKEVVFKTPYVDHHQEYILYEHYGNGYIRNELFRGDNQVDIKTIQSTESITDWAFDKSVMLAVPLKIYESAKFEGRGGSIYDSKLDSFDAFDEAWSQWMDALRAGRAKTYIPECLIPRNYDTGEILSPNPFDNRYIKSNSDMSENAKNQIDTEQPLIPHESYLASYVTALDLCLQGIISPSTLGIDVKKLDNAEAQREKEKATLYTRNAIVEALQETLPDVIATCINAYNILNNQTVEVVKVNIPFGEYANPSFESQVETIGKAKTQGIMSIERCVEELYGDTLDEHCKQEEIARLKAEQGIADVEEPGINLEGVNIIEGQSGKQDVPDEPE
ncbi:MAG: capsid protein [Faecalicatena sp.]|uniref:capsid protein n=1 Tax=Faecalicatena sp. TaxID=2005360 RepID=UPI002584EF6F|nr:capsid protein [Faecalicatena sp.]MCI6467459.1 capsid protein [Faecalicatena sp.]MDY5618159.1 capsid protein [Lachnospiraceae bacterium]